MLVLSRKARQQIQISGGITITILQVKGAVVRVGIEAPDDVHVARAEIAGKPPRTVAGPSEGMPPRAEDESRRRGETRAAADFLPASEGTTVSTGQRPEGRLPAGVSVRTMNAAPAIRPQRRLGPSGLRAMAMLGRGR